MADEIKEPQVECDFSRISRRWGKKWSKIDHQMTKQNQKRRRLIERRIKLDDEEPDAMADESNPTEDELKVWTAHAKRRNKLQDEEIKIEGENQALEMDRDALMAQVITKVPAEWLVDDAPPDIDWKNPENLYDYVLEKHARDLYIGVVRARLDEAKN